MKFHQEIKLSIDYPVLFKQNIFSTPVGDYWSEVIKNDEPAKAIFFIDENVARCHPKLIENIKAWNKAFPGLRDDCPIKVVPPGEQLKNDFNKTIEIAAEIAGERICRHSYVIIVGGGAILDAIGFAASITHRGIRQIRIPTTVLAQDDSAMGVKNGTNYNGVKNLFGSFYAPSAVICDFDFLTTLEQRDWVSGCAEAFKVAIIKDIKLLHYLSSHAAEIPLRNHDVMEQVIRQSAKIHLNHIGSGGDPFETGSTRPLDFGHWSAHKLESMSKGSMRHGEAVSVGIALDLFCAVELGLIEERLVRSILKTMQKATLPIWSELLDQEAELIEGLAEFQEHIGGKLTLTMPNGLGQSIEIHQLPSETIHNAIANLKYFKGE